MKCMVATEPLSPVYVTTVKCVSDHTSHSFPSLYLETSCPGRASWKQVIRPLWLLAPKLPRKYPLTETSPPFGLGAGEATERVGTAAGVAGVSGDGLSACSGADVSRSASSFAA